MEKIFLITLILFEIGFVIFSLVKGSRQDQIRNKVRVCGFLVFLILAITPILSFSFRWYMVAILLLLYAIIGGVKLYKATPSKPFRKGKVVLQGILMCILFFFACVPGLVFPDYKPIASTGMYDVATKEITYTDSEHKYLDGKNNYVNVAFWYPKNPEDTNKSFPLVVFDHGAYGVKDSNFSAFVELASHGYVVCSIDHPGHSFFTKSDTGKMAMMDMNYYKEVMYANSVDCTAKEAYDYIGKWMDVRVSGINLTLDTILQYAQETDAKSPYNLIDTEKIGLFGHSMGAASSVWVGQEREDIDAIINIDGPYFSELSYDETNDDIVAKGEAYDTPILNIYSDSVWNQIIDDRTNGVYAGNKIADTICKENYTMYLKGAKHLTLTDLALISPFLTNMLNREKATIDVRYCLKTEQEAILSFFDCYLKGGPAYTMTGTFTK
ncbi:alpha/beta hydrolase family protein [Anaerosporobacter faecicola]|uniref:alpha/beta hydrolase family protein n=1 Tax=Anaerosporobacter faecicola TaxID=2718714 RepID=UPI00143A4734|nr:alpha/beta hydrolase [Anaerosporobacter faecicola]